MGRDFNELDDWYHSIDYGRSGTGSYKTKIIVIEDTDMDMRYIATDESGWLRVKLEPSGSIVPLPQYLKVTFLERRSGRDHFKIEEGVYKDKIASVSQRSGSSSWLGKPRPVYKKEVSLTFKKSEGNLTTPIGTFKAITAPENPIPNGSTQYSCLIFHMI